MSIENVLYLAGLASSIKWVSLALFVFLAIIFLMSIIDGAKIKRRTYLLCGIFFFISIFTPSGSYFQCKLDNSKCNIAKGF